MDYEHWVICLFVWELICQLQTGVQKICVKDALMGIPKTDLLGMTVTVLQTSGY